MAHQSNKAKAPQADEDLEVGLHSCRVNDGNSHPNTLND